MQFSVYCFIRNSCLLKIWSAICLLFGFLLYFVTSSFRISNSLSRSLDRIDPLLVMLLRRSCPSSFRLIMRPWCKNGRDNASDVFPDFQSSVIFKQNRIVSHFWPEMRWHNFWEMGRYVKPKWTVFVFQFLGIIAFVFGFIQHFI